MKSGLLVQTLFGFCSGLWMACSAWSSSDSKGIRTLSIAESPLLQEQASSPYFKNLFQVDNISVDVTSSSAHDAREMAIIEAQRKAFQVLLQRILPEGEQEKFTALTDAEIEFMVQDFELESEKITKIRYMGTFSFRFNPGAVEKVVGKEKIKPQHSINDPQEILILPVYRKSYQNLLWGENNPWFTAWETYTFPETRYKMILPVGDLQDINDLPIQDALAVNHDRIRKMLERYKAQQAVITVYKVGEGSAPSSLEIYHLSAAGLIAPPESILLDISANGDEQSFSSGIARVREVLANYIKGQGNTQISKTISAQIFFSKLEEWVAVRELFERFPLIQNFTVEVLSATQAGVSFDTSAMLSQIKAFLQLHAFETQENADGTLEIIFSGLRAGASLSDVKGELIQTDLAPDSVSSLPHPDKFPVNRKESPYYMPSEVVPSRLQNENAGPARNKDKPLPVEVNH